MKMFHVVKGLQYPTPCGNLVKYFRTAGPLQGVDQMRTFLVLLVLMALALSAQAVDPTSETAEFKDITVTGSEIISLSSVYQHFLIITDTDMLVRFVLPTYNATGTVNSFVARPFGDPTVPNDSGPRPDAGDTTLTVSAALAENIFNDIPAKKLLLTGTGIVTIKAKK